jgi:hypothetical protein
MARMNTLGAVFGASGKSPRGGLVVDSGHCWKCGKLVLLITNDDGTSDWVHDSVFTFDGVRLSHVANLAYVIPEQP